MLFGDPAVFFVTAIFLIPAVIVAIPAHELAHAAAASRLGDPSPLNIVRRHFQPRAFFEPCGVLSAFLANVAWGIPVRVNESRLRGAAAVIYSVAGPLANLALALVSGLLLRFLGLGDAFLAFLIARQSGDMAGFVGHPLYLLGLLLYAFFVLNLAMFAFNLLPIPGLDGWRIVETLLRRRNPRFFFDIWSRRREVWVFCVIAVLVASLLLHLNLVGVVISPLYEPLSQLILGQCAVYTSLQPCPL